MPRRVKEEEKIEMIIRGLLKQTDNRRCINCNSLGPQYVCTTFWTFVCTSCSGVHREFTHRVKSVSMAKFNEEEITSLQAGGNERAKQIYFKTWDPQRNYYPDGSNLHKLREFIKHVYLERRYAGENSSNRLSMIKLDSTKNYCELRPFEKPRDDFLERPTFERTSSFDKYSPSIRTNGRTFKDILEERSPRCSSSSRNRTARFEIVDDRFRDDGSVKHYDRNSSKNKESQTSTAIISTLPIIRPVKDFVGEKAPELTIGGPRNAIVAKETSESAKVHRETEATDEERKQEKAVTSSSLIDFDAKTEPSSNTETKTDNERRSIESSVTPVSANAPNNNNSLECLLFDWSGPATSPSTAADVATAKEAEKNDQPLDSSSGVLVVQEQNKPHAISDLRLVQSVAIEQPSQASDHSTARKEIPQDLFSSNFTPLNPTGAGWPMHQPNYGRGYGFPFNPPMPVAAYPNPAKPHNPFDIGDDRFQVQSSTFSASMSPLQGALPNAPPSAASHMSPYGMNMPLVPGAYIGQLPSNMPLTRPQGIADFGRSENMFSSLNPIQQARGTDSSPAARSSPVSRAGNPFG